MSRTRSLRLLTPFAQTLIASYGIVVLTSNVTFLSQLHHTLINFLMAIILTLSFMPLFCWLIEPLSLRPIPVSAAWILGGPILIGAASLYVVWLLNTSYLLPLALLILVVECLIRDRFFPSTHTPLSLAPRPRLHLRTLSAAIMIFALFWDLLMLSERSAGFRHLANGHAGSAAFYSALLGEATDGPVSRAFRGTLLRTWNQEEIDYFRSMEQYHSAQSNKYRAAARHPWSPVPPDPPEPDRRVEKRRTKKEDKEKKIKGGHS